MKKLNKMIGSLVLVLMLVLVPKLVLADKIENMISSKEVHIKSVPATEKEFMYQVGDFFNKEYPEYTIDAESCNKDFTECNVLKQGTVVIEKAKIIYDYDPAVKKVADSLIKNLKTDKDNMFFLNAVEAIEYYDANFKMYRAWYEENEDNEEAEEPEPLNMGDYSSELKKFFQYKNFSIRVGMGEDTNLYFTQAGNTMFIYNDTLYGVSNMITVVSRNVVYIPKNSANIEEAVKDYFTKYYEVKEVTKEEHSKLSDILADEEKDLEDYYDEYSWIRDRYSSKEEYVTAMMNESYYNDDAPGHFMAEAEPYFYTIELDDERAYSFAVIKDDEKAKEENKVKSSDIETGVEISTDGIIPLDTLIQVARLTSGEDYEKIVKILKVKDAEMFDLKLFSKSAEDYITKLDNGTFEVKLPISEALKGKDLIVYYVDENDKVIEYKVEVKDDYAVFNTDHFSIYTLATTETTKETNPDTYDNIMTYITLLLISVISVYFISRKVKSNI